MLNFKKTVVAVLFLSSALWALRPAIAPIADQPLTDQVSFFEVPLMCPAARNLGCGSAAKPVLAALEKEDRIQEAWLDHSGTRLAIVWKKSIPSEERTAAVRSVAEDRGISLTELAGDKRLETLKSFESRKEWYRGAEVDRLSEEEAAIITDRLIRRAAQKAPTITGKSERLKIAVTEVIRARLTVCNSTQCREDSRKKLIEIARKSLNDQEFDALMDAEKLGYRPVGDER